MLSKYSNMEYRKYKQSEYYKNNIYDADLETQVNWSMNCFGEMEMILWHDDDMIMVNHPFEVVFSRTGKFTIISVN